MKMFVSKYLLCLFLLSILCVDYTLSFHGLHQQTRSSRRFKLDCNGVDDTNGSRNGNNPMADDPLPTQIERSTTPSRYDVCRVFVTGDVCTEPRETYLANGHYVVNFAIATIGHFVAQHDWERYKPTEIMYLSSEMWDEQARSALNEVNFVVLFHFMFLLALYLFHMCTDKTLFATPFCSIS